MKILIVNEGTVIHCADLIRTIEIIGCSGAPNNYWWSTPTNVNRYKDTDGYLFYNFWIYGKGIENYKPHIKIKFINDTEEIIELKSSYIKAELDIIDSITEEIKNFDKDNWESFIREWGKDKKDMDYSIIENYKDNIGNLHEKIYQQELRLIQICSDLCKDIMVKSNDIEYIHI